MVKANNPAGRLYLLLQELRKQPGPPLQSAWANVLGIQDDTEQVLVLLVQVVNLVQETKNLILKQNVDHSLYLKPFIKIQQLLAVGLGSSVSGGTQYLDDTTMLGLEHCAELLSRQANEPIFESELLTRLQSEVDALLERVMDTQFSEELKVLILDNLNFIRNSILNYRIRGTKGIEDAIKNAMGSAHYFSILSGQNADLKDEHSRQVVRDFTSLIEEILSIITNALGIAQLTAGVAIPLLKS
jgi:hypothetical protein